MHQVKQRLGDSEAMTIGQLRELLSSMQPYVGTGVPGVAAARLRIAMEIERLERLADESPLPASQRIPVPHSA
jgi:hypothetical protein